MKRVYTTRPAKKTAQQGQAIAEMLVATTFVLSVLLLAVVMLGKFNDVRNRTLMGSRYVAWERTVWLDSSASGPNAGPGSNRDWSSRYGDAAMTVSKSDLELKNEFMQRMLSANGSAILGSDRAAPVLPGAQPAMWKDYGGTPFLNSGGSVVVSTGTGDAPAANLANYTASFGNIRTANGGTYSTSMNLPTHNLQSGSLSITVAKNSETLQRLWSGFTGLTFQDSNVLLTNTWLPDGSASAKAQFAQAVPAANTALIDPALYLSMQKYAPEIGSTAKLEFGRVQQDVVPYNRVYQPSARTP
ncbi:hypothetical protein [Paraburkholderia sp.]|uniref:hypothetical protein n=1 Tax=Paraburkholderia sp. TaxID=1926495 RepID=UPI0023A6731B|nr:hypothetical protein [Paraburkholderia sp.]MDE1182032.1 hypothetical protein [Paraburkholderia sp.]